MITVRCNTPKPLPGGEGSGGIGGASKNGSGNVPGGGVVGGAAAREAGERPTIGQIRKRYGGFSEHVHQSLLVSDRRTNGWVGVIPLFADLNRALLIVFLFVR